MNIIADTAQKLNIFEESIDLVCCPTASSPVQDAFYYIYVPWPCRKAQ